MSHTSGAFYALTMRLFEMLRQKESGAKGQAVLVSSARREEGKTFLARVLAQHMAELSADRVLLVDANLENPALHPFYGLKNETGFSDALATENFAAVKLHDTPQANLKVMTVGQTRKPGLLFRPHAFEAFLKHFEGDFGLILIDGGVLGTLGCIPHLSTGIVMVVDSSRTRREVIQGVLSTANIEPSRFLGAVLNKRIQYIPRALYRYF